MLDLRNEGGKVNSTEKKASKKELKTHVSSCTLRLSDSQMQSNFVEYLRDETRKKSLVALIFFVLVTILLCGSYIHTSEDE